MSDQHTTSSEWQPGELSVSCCAASQDLRNLVKAYTSCRIILQRKLIVSAKKCITVLGNVKIAGSVKLGVFIQNFQLFRPEAPENAVLLWVLIIASVNT